MDVRTMDLRQIALLLGVLCGRTKSQATITHLAETSLRSTLTTGYDTTVRPSTPTTVYMYYSIKSLRHLDITSQTLSMAAWITMYWEDPRLRWTPSNYSNIDQLDINFAWRPEFGIVNSYLASQTYRGSDTSCQAIIKRVQENMNTFGFYGADTGTTRLRVFNTGMVRWLQFMGTDTQCDVDIKNFPYDKQSCDVELVFWGNSITDVTFNVTMDAISTMRYVAHSEWKLESTSISSTDVQFCCPASTHKMFFINFVYTRLRPYYIMNLVLPTILLSICSIWVFYLPTDSGERLGFSLTILLAYTVQMSITAALMPTTSKQVPHIAMYLLVVLVLCTMLLCNVVLHVKLFFLEDDPPDWVKNLYLKAYPMVFCSSCPKKASSNQVQVINHKAGELLEEDLTIDPNKSHMREKADLEDNTETDAKIDAGEEITWAKVSYCMDRMCFFYYLTVTISLNTYFIIKLHVQ